MDHLETLEPHALHRLDHYRAPGQGMTLTRDRVGDELVLRKSARGGQRAALRREAEVLRALGGHGVVRLIELVDGADVTELERPTCVMKRGVAIRQAGRRQPFPPEG